METTNKNDEYKKINKHTHFTLNNIHIQMQIFSYNQYIQNTNKMFKKNFFLSSSVSFQFMSHHEKKKTVSIIYQILLGFSPNTDLFQIVHLNIMERYRSTADKWMIIF